MLGPLPFDVRNLAEAIDRESLSDSQTYSLDRLLVWADRDDAERKYYQTDRTTAPEIEALLDAKYVTYEAYLSACPSSWRPHPIEREALDDLANIRHKYWKQYAELALTLAERIELDVAVPMMLAEDFSEEAWKGKPGILIWTERGYINCGCLWQVNADHALRYVCSRH